jgi:hypothetical protein
MDGSLDGVLKYKVKGYTKSVPLFALNISITLFPHPDHYSAVSLT